ncbi:MAG: preprotein translocase subunit TatC [Planctomycetes bacterium]|nr:preprotein translocase subunit TatC [Planctomycetota bacterium]
MSWQHIRYADPVNRGYHQHHMTQKPRTNSMSFGEHLEELRFRLILALICPLVLAIPGMIFGKHILAWLARPVYKALENEGLPARMQALTPVEAFVAYIKVALISAVVCSAPLLVYQLWKFIEPGLYKHERRFVYLLIPMSTVLTFLGIAFLYYIMLPLSLRMLIRFGNALDLGPTAVLIEPAVADGAEGSEEGTVEQGQPPPEAVVPGEPPTEEDPPAQALALPEIPVLEIAPATMAPGEIFYHEQRRQLIMMQGDGTLVVIDTRPVGTSFTQEYRLKDYLSFIFSLILAFGIAFQLPLVMLLLGWVGIVQIDQLRHGRRYAVMAVFVAGAMLTPPDVVSQLALAIPLYALYEVSIILLRVIPLRTMTRETADKS